MKSQNTYTKDKIHTKQRNKTRAHFRVLTNKENGRKKNGKLNHMCTLLWNLFQGVLNFQELTRRSRETPGKLFYILHIIKLNYAVAGIS